MTSPTALSTGALPRNRWVDFFGHVMTGVSLIVSAASLAVAVIAMNIANDFSERPVPADPTRLASFGTQQDPVDFHTREEARRLVQFLKENADKRVRIYARFDVEIFGAPGDPLALTETLVRIPSEDCLPTVELCTYYHINVLANDGEGRFGIQAIRTTYYLTGYFANLGETSTFMSEVNYVLMPLTAVEAVSP